MRHFQFLAAAALGLAGCGSGDSAAGDAAPPKDPGAAAGSPSAPAAAAPPIAVIGKDVLAKEVCYFKAEEVEAALGFKVEKVAPQLDLASHGSFSCRYEGKDNVLQLNLLWVDPSYVEASRRSGKGMSAGDKEDIAGDPDGAYLQVQQELGGALHYMRQNVMVEVRPLTWRLPPAEMKARLLKLRRVP